nr:MAG TPA: hypothetical protein [Bacteriophage sp.]
MVNILNQGEQTTAYLMSYVTDTEADIITIPIKNIAIGSTCFVIETSNVYMLGSDEQWHLI